MLTGLFRKLKHDYDCYESILFPSVETANRMSETGVLKKEKKLSEFAFDVLRKAAKDIKSCAESGMHEIRIEIPVSFGCKFFDYEDRDIVRDKVVSSLKKMGYHVEKSKVFFSDLYVSWGKEPNATKPDRRYHPDAPVHVHYPDMAKLKFEKNPAYSSEKRSDTMNQIAKFSKVSFEQYQKDVIASGRWTDNTEMLRKEWENIKLPERATKGSAGYDFFLPYFTALSKNPVCFPTGIRCEIEPGWVLMLFPKSGLGFKHHMTLDNTAGVIDAKG